MEDGMSVAMTRGVLFVHSAPTALCPHVEWAVGAVVDKRTGLEWTPQPAAPGMFRAELSWIGTPGTGAKLASCLRGWAHLRYEVTEEPSQGVDGGRWSHTPELGIFHAVTDVHGNIMVSEDRIRYAYESGAGDPSAVYHELSLALSAASTAPEAPSRCPICDLVADTATSSTCLPRAALRAVYSGLSPTGVEVAWALTCTTSSAWIRPSNMAAFSARVAPRPSGSGAVMW